MALPGAPPAPRAGALWVLALAQWFAGQLVPAQATVAEMLSLARAAGDRRLEGRAHEMAGCVALYVDPEAAKEHLAAALPLSEEAGDAWSLMDISGCFLMIAARADDGDGVTLWLERAHALAEANGHYPFASWNLCAETAFCLRLGDLPRARAAAERAVTLCTSLGDAAIGNLAVAGLAEVELVEGHPERTLALAEAAVQECTDAAAYVSLPYAMTMHARALRALGRPEARAALEEALAVATEVGDPWQRAPAALALARSLIAAEDPTSVEALIGDARACGALLGSPWIQATTDHVAGLLAYARGQADQAEDLYHAALAVHVQRGFALSVVDALEALAVVAASQESWAEATRLLAATARRRDELGYGHDRPLVAPAEAATRLGLGELAFEDAWAEGAAMPIEAAVAYASRARGERKRPSFGWASLTPTELDVARLTAQGLTNAAIGAQLFMSAGTAKTHLSHIYTKLNLANRAQLTAEVMRRQS